MLAFTEYLLSRARIEDAQEAMRWLLGSLSNRGWEDLVPLLVVLALLAPAIVAAGPPMRALELGDDAAYGLGLRVERARLGLILLAVGARLDHHRRRRPDRVHRPHGAADRAPDRAHRRHRR